MKTSRLALIVLLASLLGACVTHGPAPVYAPGASPAVALSDLTPAQLAVAEALSYDPRFAGAVPFAPEAIGQPAWYRVSSESDGTITVIINLGVGDCIAGCQTQHRWTYHFSPAGQLVTSSEAGDVLPAAAPGAGLALITASLFLGPACPFPPNSTQPCVNVPVGGATLLARSLEDPTSVQANADPRGLAALQLPAGRYLLTATDTSAAKLAPPEAMVIFLAPGGGASLRLFFNH